MTEQPAIQLISNLVVRNDDGDVLLVQYDPADESSARDSARRWWLPGAELEPFDHPDDVARSALEEIDGLEIASIRLSGVDSFRGRRGWHVSFEYDVRANGRVTTGAQVPAEWYRPDALPRTVHGRWERSVIDRVVARDAG